MNKPINLLASLLLAATLVGCACPYCKTTKNPEQMAALAPVQQFFDAFNANDPDKAMAVCADPISIIDDFPPHDWSGAGAGKTWLQAFQDMGKKADLTPIRVTLHRPLHVDVTGDHAYVVVPADFTFKKAGKLKKQSGSLFTAVLKKSGNTWLITSWTWSKT